MELDDSDDKLPKFDGCFGHDPLPEDFSAYSAVPQSSLSIEDIQEAIRKVEELMPKPGIDKILISEKWPKNAWHVREHKGKTYMLANKSDLEREIDSLKERFPSLPSYVDERYKLPAGVLGMIAGIPIVEDDVLILEICMEEIRHIPRWFYGI